MESNLAKFAKVLKSRHLDGFIVTNPTNILYLTGFKGISPTEREALLVFNPKPTLITARLYQNEAKKLKSKLLDIEITAERNRLTEVIQKLLKNSKRVGFESQDLKFAEYKEFKKKLKAKLVPAKNLIEDLRITKTEEEINKISKAQIISQKAFENLVKVLKVGQTEEEIAEKLATIIKSFGGQGLAFESIIASGPNSGKPHHFTSNRRLTINDILLLDFGAKFENYHADLSRTIFIGKASDSFRNIFNHVLKAQKKAIEKIASRAKSHEIHNIAVDVFKSKKLEKYFIHGLGHGIGLEVHEKPHLRPLPKRQSSSKSHSAATPEVEELLENMVFSIEPGLYFPWGGVRIEDLVVIKNGEAKVLGSLQEKIITVK